MRIIYGTSNRGKIEQVKGFFRSQKIDVEILSLEDIGFDKEIEENGKTFEENSLIKALEIKKYCDEKGINEIIITDDAGLCVDALEGAPGVYSARYAGDHAPQEVVIKKLLDNLKDVEMDKRTAQFECVLTAILPDSKRIISKGLTNGKIAIEPGTMGKLTYGPVFIPDGFNRVMNELTDEELGKTHREKAFMDIIGKLSNIKQ